MKKQIENLIENNNTAEAKKILFNAINQRQDDPKLYLMLGSVYSIESNFELAVQYYNKAFEIAPNDYDVVSSICNFLIASNCKQDAKDIMDAYIERQQQNNKSDEKFSYFDFIIGGEDAINYSIKEQPADIKEQSTDMKKQPAINTRNIAIPQKDDYFSYKDLIFNNINDVLEQHNLEKIENNNVSPRKIGDLPCSDAEPTIFPTESIFPNSDEEKDIPEQVYENVDNTNKMPIKILFVTFGWNETGGGVAVPKSIAKEFVKKGYEVVVFYAALEHPINKTPYYLEEASDSGVHLYGLYNRPAPLYDFDNPLREINDENVVRAFNQVLDKVQPNIVHIHNLHGLTLELASIIKRSGIVTTFTTHNYHLIDPKAYMYDNNLVVWKDTDFFANSELPVRFPHLRESYKKRIEKCKELIFNDIDYIFAVSNRVKDLFVEFSGDSERANNKICVINQVLPVVNDLTKIANTKTKISDGKIRFAFIGDGLPHKGCHIIAQALQMTPNKNFTIDIWGRYFDVSEYGRAIKQFDRNNIMRIRGTYSYNDFGKIAENTDVMLFPSIWEEAQGLVLSEALAMNIPVIASKIGGIEDTIIDGFNGITYLAHSPKALAAVINMLIENPYKIPQLKANARLPYTFDTYINHLEGVTLRLVNGERPGASEFNLLFADNLQKR